MDGYWISKDSSKINVNQAIALLRQTKWAKERQEEKLRQAIENSLCYGVFDRENRMAGFARVITDYTTTFYLMDVVVEEKLRGKKIGSYLMDEIMKDFGHLYGILHTEDAEKFYEKYGFVVTNGGSDKTMEKKR